MAENSTKTSRYQSLDLWRGLICLFVVLEHAAVALWHGIEFAPGWEGAIKRFLVAPFQTNLGTPLFFVISGYCIAASVESCRRRGMAPTSFLLRRCWRVFPSYWIALFGFVALIAGLDAFGLSHLHRSPYGLELSSVAELDRWQWFGNLTLSETWRGRFVGHDANVFTRVAWSLCYQEQFYLVCFVALVAARTRVFRALGIGSLVIVAIRVAASDVGKTFLIEGTFALLWHQFAVGIAAYWYLNKSGSHRAKTGVLAALGGMLAAGYWSGDHATAASSGFGLALVGLRRWDAAWSGVRLLEPLRAIGRRSYSIYLVHLPVVVVLSAVLADLGVTGFVARALVMVPLATVAAVAAGLAFYRLVETRFLELPTWGTLASPAARPILAPRPSGLTFAEAVSGIVRLPSMG